MRDKKKITIISLCSVAAVLIVLMVVVGIYKLVAPSSEKKDLNDVFQVKGNQVALIIDGIKQEETGIKKDGDVYVSAAMADYFDERAYVDETERILSYATNDGLIQALPDQKDYIFGVDKKTAKTPILTMIDNKPYVSVDFLKERASTQIKEFDSPSRIVVMSDRDKEYTVTKTATDVRVRTGPGKKYSYLEEIPQGKQLIVDENKKEENGFKPVITDDGVHGYVAKEDLNGELQATWKFEKSPEAFKAISMKKKVCLGWHQVSNEVSSKTVYSGTQMASSMNVICPTFYELSSENTGTFSSSANADYVSDAHAKNLKVWGLVSDFNKGVKLSIICGRTSSRIRLVNALVGSAVSVNLDGINVDFEHVTKTNAKGYLEFLRELVLKCHANNIIVSVDNYPCENFNTQYNVAEQAKVADYVILMAYDEHYSGSEESGSVSSLSYVERGTDNMLKKVPKDKLIVGLPFYSRLWKEVNSKKGLKISSESYGMSAAESVIHSNDAKTKWDESTSQYYASYKSGKATYKIWLEEETSLEKKLRAVNKRKTAGVAFWKLGFERAATWKTIAENLK